MSENWDTSKDEFGSFKRENQPNEEYSDVTRYNEDSLYRRSFIGIYCTFGRAEE